MEGNCDEHINHHFGSRVCGEIVFLFGACLYLFGVVIRGNTFCNMSPESCLQFGNLDINLF